MSTYDYSNDDQPLEMNEVEPWRRQPWDSSEIWSAYRMFLQLPAPRALAPVVAYAGHPLPTIQRWAREGHWTIRVEAFDKHVQGLWFDTVRDVVVSEATDVAQQHAETLKDLATIARLEVGKLLEDCQRNKAFGAVKPTVLLKMVEAAIKLHRLTNDQTTDKIDVVSDLTTVMSMAQIKQLNELQGLAIK